MAKKSLISNNSSRQKTFRELNERAIAREKELTEEYANIKSLEESAPNEEDYSIPESAYDDLNQQYDDSYEIFTNIISLLEQADKLTADFLIEILEEKTNDSEYTDRLFEFLSSGIGQMAIEKSYNLIRDSKADDIFQDASYIIWVLFLGQYSNEYASNLQYYAEIDEINMRSTRGKSHYKRELDT